ncbi:hypothetical protein BGZ75_005695 [Mortierella antarctica]|nr:hypothetical protein BGZ75_005695 [Mortierella antarctica]
MKYAVQTLSIISKRVYQYLDILKTLSLDIGVDDEEHSAHAHFITDALAAFEELTYADRSDEATSDEDEGDHGFTSSDVHAAPRLADHMECYHITNIYWHNHELARDITVVQYLSAPAKGRIENLLRNGSCLREVLQRLQGGTDHFVKLGKTRVFRNDIITYEDVYKEVYYRMMIIETRKDEDPEVSAQMWLEELAAEGYFTCFQKGVYYGFSSPWQLEQLKKNGDTFCFDGTYKVYGRDNFRISYTPKVVVTDQGSVEILAIRSAFSPVRIHYCAWHVLRAWERKWTNALLGVEGSAFPADDRKSAKARVRTELRRIMYESQLDKATALIEKFRLDHVERTDLAKHLEEGYFSENQEQRWMLCYRQGLYGIAIDTNNYVESWHSSLKTHFFKDHRKQRLDSVIYTVVKAVYPFTNAGAESTAWTVVGWTLYRGKR